MWKQFRQVLRWSDPPEWTNSHAAHLQTFMKSEVGVQLNSHLRNLHFQNCDQLISSPGDLAYLVGHAAGFKSALATLDGMASIRSQPEEEAVGVTDDLAWMRAAS